MSETRSIGARALDYGLAFFEQNTRQSMARLAGFMAMASGCAVAIICAVKGTEQWQTVSALVVGGAVGLIARQRAKGAADAA